MSAPTKEKAGQPDTSPNGDNDSVHSKTTAINESHTDTETPRENPSEPEVEKPAQNGPGYDPEAEKNYQPKTLKFWLIIFSIFISMFLVALDRTIVSTAVPRITDEFKSLGDIGWYGSAYMLTTAACQLLFGRIYRFYSIRWTFLVTIVIFEIGSAVCGAAPNSTAFIIGRAIAGIGGAGIFTGSMMAMIPMIPLRKRPMFQSLFGMVFGISSVIGPLLGGAFTDKVTWRWCFYINLPVGAAALVFLFLFMHPAETKHEEVSADIKEQIMRLDPLGTFFFVPATVSLLLALQWGGSTYPWSNWRIIVLFVVAGLAALAFAAVQYTMPKTASLPGRIIKQRTVLASTFYMFFLAGAMLLVIFYLPLWFQATKGVSPVKSGIYTIPLVLSLVVASLLNGAFTQRIGYYTPSMLICPCVSAVGAGLMTTFRPDTGSNHWIGYQFIYGFGLGMGMQTAGLAVQAVLPREDVSTGMAVTFFAQQLGGAIFVTVGQTILSTELVKKLAHIQGMDPMMIVKTGATELRKIVPPQYIGDVINAYNYAITRIFFAGLALVLAQLIAGLFVEWRSIKKPGAGKPPAGESAAKTEKASEA